MEVADNLVPCVRLFTVKGMNPAIEVNLQRMLEQEERRVRGRTEIVEGTKHGNILDLRAHQYEQKIVIDLTHHAHPLSLLENPRSRGCPWNDEMSTFE